MYSSIIINKVLGSPWKSSDTFGSPRKCLDALGSSWDHVSSKRFLICLGEEAWATKDRLGAAVAYKGNIGSIRCVSDFKKS